MKALSIMQPWASMIVLGYKPVENRTWKTSYRGPLLIHAGKRFDYEAFWWIMANRKDLGVPAWCLEPHAKEILRSNSKSHGFPVGGIIGQVLLSDCVSMDARGPKRWFFGPYGFLMQMARELPFRPLRGQLGFFEVPDA